VRERVRFENAPRGPLSADLAALLASGAAPASGDLTPTPAVLDELPDLPEYLESARDAEALEELEQLTSRLRGSLAATTTADRGPGLVFGPYRLIEKVATGGMAEIFRAARRGVEGFEKTVAVKRILPHLSDNREFVTMFVDEAKTVAQLAHPNIVSIYDLGRIHGSYYIAMEYVHGRDLRSILRRSREKELPLAPGLAVLIASRVCAGLGYAHRRLDERGRPMKIVHRDVSPQNILISFEGDVKLTDFGIATAAHKASVTERGMLRGKLTYMSPEQTRGGRVDHRSDLFSLGVVLYELATGERPFGTPGHSDANLLEAIRACDFAPARDLVPGLPPSLDRVLQRALAREPHERYADADALRRELELILRDELSADSLDLESHLAALFTADERRDPSVDDASTLPGVRIADLEAEAAAETWEPPGTMTLERLLQRFGDA
jgi:serine/threonine protein kinase